MNSIDFPEANTALAKDQPHYKTIFVHAEIKTNKRQMIVCFELSDEEVERIIKDRKLWYAQSTFGQLFQPMVIMTANPFNNPIHDFKPPIDDNKVSDEEWDKTHFVASLIVSENICANCGKPHHAHYFSTRQCDL